jgi:hypothetical protein
MRFRVSARRFVLLGYPEARGAEVAAALSRRAAAQGAEGAADARALRQLVFEDDVVTVFAPEEDEASLPRDPAARILRGRRLVTFETPMSWDVVGFLARVTTALAEGGVPIGAICGFDRDHLFLDERYLERARAVLAERICPQAAD